jgi:RNA polymerase sigma-70 factor, ECF subfamily
MKQDEFEFQKIFNEYQPRILQYLISLTNKFEAEDLTQEVFIKVESGLINFRGDSKLSTWIYRIATNTALDRMRNPSFKYKTHKPIAVESILKEDFDIEDKVLVA